MNELFREIGKYNCWEGKLLPAGIPRTEYLDAVSGYTGNRLVKVIMGQRRVGKSYLLRQIINSLITGGNVNPRNILFVNKEFPAFDEICSSRDLDELVKHFRSHFRTEGKIFLFLDEVQRISEWESIVNSYSQDYTQDIELFITGSNSRMLSGELATLLSGRYVEFEVFPFSFREYAEISKVSENRENYLTYLRTGALPELSHLKTEELQRNYVSSLKNTIVLRDIIERHKIKDLPLLEDLFRYLSVNAGNLTSVNSLVKYYKSRQKKTNYETLSSYVGYLTETFAIHRADRYNLRGKKILGGESKYYLNDLAFKNLLLGFHPEDPGYNLENLVFIQLRRMGYQVYVGKLDSYEIDFIARKHDTTRYIQVCYHLGNRKVIDREFGNLLKIKDNFEKIVISLDETQFSDYKGIRHLRPWELI